MLRILRPRLPGTARRARTDTAQEDGQGDARQREYVCALGRGGCTYWCTSSDDGGEAAQRIIEELSQVGRARVPCLRVSSFNEFCHWTAKNSLSARTMKGGGGGR